MPARVREAASAMRTEETTLANALTWIINLLLGSRIKIPFSFLVKNRETFLGVSRRIASRKKVSLAGILVIHLRIRNVSVIQTHPKLWSMQEMGTLDLHDRELAKVKLNPLNAIFAMSTIFFERPNAVSIRAILPHFSQ